MIFTDAQKKTITRRQLNILLENATHDRTLASLMSQQGLLLEVDEANAVYYDYYDMQAKSYEAEYRALAGAVAANYLASDINAAALNPTIPPFFPTSPMYINLIPKVITSQKGIFSPTSVDAVREDNFIVGLAPHSGVLGSLNFAIGAGTYPTFDSVPCTPAGPTGVNLSSPTPLLYNIGDYIIIGLPGDQTTIIRVNSISITSNYDYFCDIISGPSINNTVDAMPYTGFTQAQRLTGFAGFNNAITNLRTYINTQINIHKVQLQNSINALNTQNDTRSPQSGQNTAAILDAGLVLSKENDWLALSVNNAMGSIEALLPFINARAAFITTRKAQIILNLGSSDATAIIQSGEAFSTTVPLNTYYQRYKWLNARINRASGSLRRYYSSNDSAEAIINLKNQNILLLEEYNLSFNTKAIIQLNQTELVNLNDNVGLSVNDEVSITSDTQPIIKRIIVEVKGTTEVVLNYPIPAPYVQQEKVRLFKEL